MKLKKYIGNTMPEVMQQIRAELGSDAVILNTKEIDYGGFLGLFTKKKLEVVAAIDPEPIQQKNEPKVVKDNFHSENKHSKDRVVLEELQQLKKVIYSQMESNNNLKPQYIPSFEYLKKQEVDEHLSEQLITKVIELAEQQESEPTQTEIIRMLHQQIEQSLFKHISEAKQTIGKIIHIVGPTGVGKTTTLAKVAANSILQDNKKVAFITTDTYRIAAIDQLKTYAQILNVPIEVAYTKEDYLMAIEKFASYDLIYVDTAGRNFRNSEYVKDLKTIIDLHEKTETFLVLSLTAKPKDINDIFNEFKLLNIKNVIFTKVDETRQYGNILNVVLNNDVTVAYLTNGQAVPNDILIPTASSISHLIMGDYFNE